MILLKSMTMRVLGRWLMNSVEIKFGGSFTNCFGNDIIDPDGEKNFYDILQRNLFFQNFDLKKVDYGRHGEGSYICINKELKTYSDNSDKKFQKVADIIDDSIDEYVDDFYNRQAGYEV